MVFIFFAPGPDLATAPALCVPSVLRLRRAGLKIYLNYVTRQHNTKTAPDRQARERVCVDLFTCTEGTIALAASARHERMLTAARKRRSRTLLRTSLYLLPNPDLTAAQQ